jgi:DNA-binding XRE family transcriptional regulator
MTDIIERNGQRFALVPIETYERMLDDLDDLDDIRAYDRAMSKKLTFVPAETVDRILAGESPVRVWREHRNLTQQQLADRARLSKPYVSQIESKSREPSLDALRRLAAALEVDVDDLI